MDPTANLKELRELYKSVLKDGSDNDTLNRMAELIEALDQWITNGGFLPNQWTKL